MTLHLQKEYLVQDILSSVSQKNNYDLNILDAYCTSCMSREVFTLNTLHTRGCKGYL